MPNATPLACSHRKYVDAGWVVDCSACGFDNRGWEADLVGDRAKAAA